MIAIYWRIIYTAAVNTNKTVVEGYFLFRLGVAEVSGWVRLLVMEDLKYIEITRQDSVTVTPEN